MKANSAVGTVVINSKMFRIAYILPNGDKHHGSYCLTKDLAEAWVTSLNEQYLEVQHWVEEFTN